MMEVLSCLAEHAGEVVPKRTLIDEVWQIEFVAENTLTRAIAVIRRALGDNASNPTYIQTIPKRGYRLLAEIEWEQPRGAGPDSITAAVAPPVILTDGDFEEPGRPVFVARQSELAKLDRLLDAALEGRGVVAFVTGEAGTGKTALVGKYCRQAQERLSDLVVVTGACNAATGAGDPYCPWRQVLSQLSGDVESLVARGVLSVEAGRRLWDSVPVFAEAVTDSGRDLVDTLVRGTPLLARSAAVAPDAPWLDDLHRLVRRRAAEPPDVTLQQGAIFRQLGRVLRTFVTAAPLVVVLDDLHWADSASIDLLCDLGRDLGGSRLLIVGSFRPEDVAIGRANEAHPLTPVIAELQRVHGDISVLVGATDKRRFVDLLIDSEANSLDEEFREELYSHTHGHALFTVELLRTLQERGVLNQKKLGGWTVEDELDWSTLPAKVEGVIAARIERLSANLRELLTIAAVEGADFTAEVLSRVRDRQTREVVKDLSRGLEKQHRLVTARGIRALAERRLSLYGFSHVLFQHYIYNGLDQVEKAHLHEDVGTVLEALYGDEASEIAPQLARHFEEAGLIDRAVDYLGRAADGARAVCAFREAESHNRRALALLESLPPSDERVAVKIERLHALAVNLTNSRGWADPEVGKLSLELRDLCGQAGDTGHLFWALWLAATYHGNRGEMRPLMPLLDEILDTAEASKDTFLRVSAHLAQLYRIFAGDPGRARDHLEMGLKLLDPASTIFFRAVIGADPRATLSQWLSFALLQLGYRDQSFDVARQAVAMADETSHPFAMAFTRGILAVNTALHDPEAALNLAEECLNISVESGFDELRLYATTAQAWAAAALGNPQPNEQVIAWMESAHFRLPLTWCLSVRCRFLIAAGKPEEASSEIARVLGLIDANEQRDIESIVHRLAGDAALVDSELEAEEAYCRAIEVARGQQAKLLELDAATALARLWHDQGRTTEARELLQPVYDWFTEGLDSRQLIEARGLLAQLEG